MRYVAKLVVLLKNEKEADSFFDNIKYVLDSYTDPVYDDYGMSSEEGFEDEQILSVIDFLVQEDKLDDFKDFVDDYMDSYPGDFEEYAIESIEVFEDIEEE
jgi:hypothetical protein